MNVYRRPGSKMWWADHFAGGKRHRKSMRTADRRKADKLAREWALQLDDLHSVARQEVKLSTAIDSFIGHCRESGLSRLTVRGYAGRLQTFLARTGDEDLAEWTPDVAYDKISAYLNTRSHEIRSTKHDRLVLSAFFSFLRAKRWYKGENPADAKLHGLRHPRRRLQKPKRCTTPKEDLVIRREGQKNALWPVLLLTRWAGMRRGEACTLRWSEVDLDRGFADIVGHEYGRKHVRRVWLADWVVLLLRAIRPRWLPEDGNWPVWPRHPDTATKEFEEFCQKHLKRRITFNDLRASFTTQCYEHGLSPMQESRIVGHSAAVAEKHYSEYDAREARHRLPPDPLTTVRDATEGADLKAGMAQ